MNRINTKVQAAVKKKEGSESVQIILTKEFSLREKKEGQLLALRFNYGGDKLWPLPEGTQDEQHWAGPLSDALDDGVNPTEPLSLRKEFTSPLAIARVSLHLVDPQGLDRGSLGEARVTRQDGTPR